MAGLRCRRPHEGGVGRRIQLKALSLELDNIGDPGQLADEAKVEERLPPRALAARRQDGGEVERGRGDQS